MEGRFGPYVTDGTTNATLPKSLAPDQLTLEEAAQLIDERAAKGPARKGAGPQGARQEEEGIEMIDRRSCSPFSPAPPRRRSRRRRIRPMRIIISAISTGSIRPRAGAGRRAGFAIAS